MNNKSAKNRVLAFAIAGVLLVTMLIGVVTIIFSTNNGSSSTNPLNDITIYSEKTELVEKETLSLSVQGKSVTGSSRQLDKVDWKSLDTALATIDAEGTLTAQREGSVVIQATVNGITTAESFSIKREANTGESVTGTIAGKTTLEAGETTTLVATFPNNSSTSIIWSSNNVSVVDTTDNDGNIKAIAAGTAQITARISGTNEVAIATVQVGGNGQVVGIDIESEIELATGASHVIDYKLLPAGVTANVNWDLGAGSTMATIATDKGVTTITAKSAGVFTLTALVGSVKAYSRVTITDVPVTGLTITGEKETTVNATSTLTVEAQPSNAWQVADWTVKSGTGKVELVNEKGAVVTSIKSAGTISYRALTEGTVTFTAKRGTISATYIVTVGKQLAATSVLITRDKNFVGDNIDLAGGSDYQLEAKVLPVSASQSVEWFSHNTEYVRIDDTTGKITTHASGVATIEARVTNMDGTSFFDTVTVTVTAANVLNLVSVHIVDNNNKDISKTIRIYKGEEHQLTGITKVTNVPSAIRWQSNNSQYATVDPLTGLVTAVEVGTTTVFARVTGNDNISYAKVNIEVLATPDAESIKIAGADVVPSGTRSDFTATTTPTGVENNNAWVVPNSVPATVTADGKDVVNDETTTGVKTEFIYIDKTTGKEVITTSYKENDDQQFATIRFTRLVNTTGVAQGSGKVWIMALHTNGSVGQYNAGTVTAYHEVTVSARPQPNNIEIIKETEGTNSGEVILTAWANIIDANGDEDPILTEGVQQHFDWYSTNENVAQIFVNKKPIVGQTGVIEGTDITVKTIGYGTATIWAEYPNTSYRTSYQITVTAPQSQVLGANIVENGVDPKIDTSGANVQTATVYNNGTLELVATAFDIKGTPVSGNGALNGDFSTAKDTNIITGAKFHFWSQETNIADVDESGVVTPVSNGTATIFAEAIGTQVRASFTVTVDLSRDQRVVDYVTKYTGVNDAKAFATTTGTLAYINAQIEKRYLESLGLDLTKDVEYTALQALISKMDTSKSYGKLLPIFEGLSIGLSGNFYDVLGAAINTPSTENADAALVVLNKLSEIYSVADAKANDELIKPIIKQVNDANTSTNA